RDDKEDRTACQRLIRFRFRLQLPGKLEVGAVADRMQQGAALGTMIGQKHAGGQVFRIRIDGVTKQNQLQERDADHHPERQAVPPHLDEFLDDDGPKPRQGKLVPLAHGYFSFFGSSMRWMKTSSKSGPI